MIQIRPLLTLLFLGLVVACAPANTTKKGHSASQVSLPVGTLDSEQLRALFSDRTVDSVTVVRGRSTTSYYSPDGEIRQRRNGKLRVGKWRITERGRICLQLEENKETCRAVAKQNGRYLKFIIKKDGHHKLVVRYVAFRDGNLLGL